MPAQLNRRPVGLLGFYGIKNGGQDPQQLGVELVPTLAVDEIYEATAQEFIQQAPAAIVNGPVLWGITASSEPSGPIHILDCAASIDSSVAAVLFMLGVYRSGTATFVPVAPPVYLSQTDASIQQGGVHAKDFWLAPGDSIAYYAPALAGSPLVRLYLRYVRYPA